MNVLFSRRVLVLVAVGLLAGCGEDPTMREGDAGLDAGTVRDAGNVSDGGTELDAGSDLDAGNVTDAGTTSDAGTSLDAGNSLDAGTGLDAGLTTRILVTLGTRSAPFDRAQHGLNADGTLYVEAHFGGDPACPSQSSPTPDRTLIINNLPVDGGAATYANGVRANLLDFSGVLTTAPIVRALDVTATPLSLQPGQQVAWHIEGIFDGGTFSGDFDAPHCDSLN